MNKTIRGEISDYERIEKYDDDGIKFYFYWIIINNIKYFITLPYNKNIYLTNKTFVVIEVDKNNNAVAGIVPLQDLHWGNTKNLKNEILDSDKFSLVSGNVIEKRKENFSISKGTTGNSSAISTNKNVTTYTIVLKDKTFRVHEDYGKHIKPNTEIVALLSNDTAFVIEDKTNNKLYGKPRKDYLIAIFLLLAFNAIMFYLIFTNKTTVMKNFNVALIIGEIFFGIAFLISFSSFLSTKKTLNVFKQMSNSNIN
ncbi:MAG: hypothetical protein LCH32_08400 [Bacteroidetes bacterium]|nr:hypothetical protein [Bacteroidota bacterium]